MRSRLTRPSTSQRADACPHCGHLLTFLSRAQMLRLGVSSRRLDAAERHPAGRLLTYWSCHGCQANGACYAADAL